MTNAGLRLASPVIVRGDMAEPVKKRRLLQAFHDNMRSSGTQTTPNTSQADAKCGEEGRMDGSILRLVMQNFL